MGVKIRRITAVIGCLAVLGGGVAVAYWMSSPDEEHTETIPVHAELDICELKISVPLRKAAESTAPTTPWNIDPGEVRCDIFGNGWAYVLTNRSYLRGGYTESEQVRGWVMAAPEIIAITTGVPPVPPRMTSVECTEDNGEWSDQPNPDNWMEPHHCLTQ